MDDTLVIVAGEPLNETLTLWTAAPEPNATLKFKGLGVTSNPAETAAGAISRQVANAVIHAAGIAADGANDRVQLAQLRQQHSPGELIHAVIQARQKPKLGRKILPHSHVVEPESALV